jgi:DnaK suppressor protein
MVLDTTNLQVEKLKAERERVLLEMGRLREAFKSEVDGNVDEGDPNCAEREKVMALMRGLDRKLESIDNALLQAENGTYGICERCGERIDPARLEVVPEATLCVRCKATTEQ